MIVIFVDFDLDPCVILTKDPRSLLSWSLVVAVRISRSSLVKVAAAAAAVAAVPVPVPVPLTTLIRVVLIVSFAILFAVVMVHFVNFLIYGLSGQCVLFLSVSCCLLFFFLFLVPLVALSHFSLLIFLFSFSFSVFNFFFLLLPALPLQPERSIQLHPLQLQLAHHACLLTRSNGGLLVYSTCSLHPLENEAIIAEMLRRHPYMELVDTKKENMLPLLIRRQGMSKWPLPRKA